MKNICRTLAGLFRYFLLSKNDKGLILAAIEGLGKYEKREPSSISMPDGDMI